MFACQRLVLINEVLKWGFISDKLSSNVSIGNPGEFGSSVEFTTCYEKSILHSRTLKSVCS